MGNWGYFVSLIVGPQVVRWVEGYINPFGRFGTDIGIGWMKGGRIVAGVVYDEFNGQNVVCHIATDKSRQWASREYLRTIFDYPFNQMKVKRITVCVGEGNTDSRRFVLKLGFKAETTLRAAHPTGDLIVFSMFKESCKWIYPGFGQRYAKAA